MLYKARKRACKGAGPDDFIVRWHVVSGKTAEKKKFTSEYICSQVYFISYHVSAAEDYASLRVRG